MGNYRLQREPGASVYLLHGPHEPEVERPRVRRVRPRVRVDPVHHVLHHETVEGGGHHHVGAGLGEQDEDAAVVAAADRVGASLQPRNGIRK